MMNNPFINECPICESSSFAFSELLWEKLIKDWQLSEYETSYINKQQGYHCTNCSANLRSMVLAISLMKYFKYKGAFKEFIFTEKIKNLKILEINEAGNLSSYLARTNHHYLGKYPALDMLDMNLEDNFFDIIIHSDTLEHVSNPLKGLEECRRVLKKGGVMFFTIPIIVDRFTRDRTGLPLSFHGNPSLKARDFVVFTEFGCDMWKYLFRAGFDNVKIESLDYPSALCIISEK